MKEGVGVWMDGAERVRRQFGLHRFPSDDEVDLTLAQRKDLERGRARSHAKRRGQARENRR